jgi:flagellar basal-body rod protein FlgF
MSNPLWPAVSGAMARDLQVEVIANNLANANTAGYKKDNVSFKEYLAKDENVPGGSAAIPHSPTKDKDLIHLEGRDQSFVVVDGTHTKFTPGGLKVTDNPLDLALDGPGFFEVSTPQGLRYTKAGSFKLSAEGKMVTTEGYPVLAAGGEGGSDPAGREINLQGHEGHLHINDKGEVYMGDDQVGTLSVVEFGDLKPVRKVGSLNFENKDPTRNPPQVATNTNVKQGMIENSNVNPVEEISNLIKANRLFEEDLKAMKTVNEMMGKEVNDIAKF